MKSKAILFTPFALALAGCTPDQAARTPVATAQAAAQATPSPTAQGNARFIGRWTGFWDGTADTTLIVSSINAAGEAVGTYQFQQSQPAAFRSPISGDTFGFGSPAVRFTFVLQPNGTLRGERNAGGLINTVSLSRS